MILFRLISWPYVRRHVLRSALTVAGIVIGVAVFVAMRAANESVFGTFQQTLQRVAGATELQVTAGAAGFEEEVLERVQALPQIAVAAPVIEAVAATGVPGQGNLLILGIDMTGDRSLRDYEMESGDAAIIEDPLVFLAQPDSIMITAEFARRYHFTTGGRLPLETVDGRREFVVRGVLSSGGLSSAFGGNIAIMDIYAAQHVFGRGRRFDRIDIGLAAGVALEEGAGALRAALGPGFQVQTPASRGQSFASLLRIYRLMLRFSSVAALVIGMFIIYNAFAIAVTERRKEIGVLRALGATRRQIAMVFVGESALAGLAGSAAGVLAGYALAGIVAGRASAFLEGVSGVRQDTVMVEPERWLVALSIAVGTLTSIAAAAWPARNAAKVDPIKALQKGRTQVLTAGNSRARAVAAAVAATSGSISILASSSLTLFYVGYLLVFTAAMLLTPTLSVWLVRAFRPILQWVRPVEGALAADSLLGAPRRTSSTVAALMLAIALAVGLAGAARATYSNITDWATHALNPDFFVTPSPTLTGRDYRFEDAMTAELASIEGIRQVQRMRQPRIDYAGTPLLLMATDVAKVAATSRRKAIEGDSEDMYRRTAAGDGLIASENFASLNHLHAGDTVELLTPSGPVRMPVAGVVRDYSDQQGSVMVDLALYRKYWKDDSLDFFRVYLETDTDPAAVREEIQRKFSSNRRLFVLSSAEVRHYVEGLTDQWFGMTRMQIAVAIFVAILGIVNSLTVTITDRRRELGVLRAVGGLRSQVRAAIWMEAICIALVGLVLGLALGAVHLYCVLEISYRDYPGLRFDYMYPYGVALLLLPVIMAAAMIAAVWPAESSVRGSLVEALEYE
jgi:putative ABC transport system permease protein